MTKSLGTITTVEQLLEAYPDFRSWDEVRSWLAEKQIVSLADAWDQCRRADWMLWLDERLDLLTDVQRRLIACRCVRETPLGDGRTVGDLLVDERSRRAVEVAERYATGEATDEDLEAASAAAYDAWNEARAEERAEARYAGDAGASRPAVARETASHVADAAAWAGWVDAARDAARVATTDTAEYAWYAARDAARAAASNAWLEAADAAWEAAAAAQADIVREISGNPFRPDAP